MSLLWRSRYFWIPKCVFKREEMKHIWPVTKSKRQPVFILCSKVLEIIVRHRLGFRLCLNNRLIEFRMTKLVLVLCIMYNE